MPTFLSSLAKRIYACSQCCPQSMWGSRVQFLLVMWMQYQQQLPVEPCQIRLHLTKPGPTNLAGENNPSGQTTVRRWRKFRTFSLSLNESEKKKRHHRVGHVILHYLALINPTELRW